MQDELNKRLAEAIVQEDVDSVRLLLAQGAEPNAIAYGKQVKSQVLGEYIHDPPLVNFLFDMPNWGTRRPVTPEMQATLLALIENGLDPNVLIRERFPLICMAASRGFDDCVLALIKRGADTNAEDEQSGQTLLNWAVNQVKLETIKAIVEQGARVNDHYTTNSEEPSSESDEPLYVEYCGVPPLNSAKDPKLIAYLRSKGAKKLHQDRSGGWFLI